MLLFGWPAYLAVNAAGPAKHAGKPNSHFSPLSNLFTREDARDVLVSVLGLVLAAAGIALAVREWGALQVAAYYGVPYLVVNMFLVLITYLQHTDDYVPHYRAGEWSFLRGALGTVDRSFGWLLDYALHHIADSHVAHHLFSTMPFYNAVEATRYLKEALGPYYLRDDTPIPYALFRSWAAARFVDDEGRGPLFMKSASMRERAGPAPVRGPAGSERASERAGEPARAAKRTRATAGARGGARPDPLPHSLPSARRRLASSTRSSRCRTSCTEQHARACAHAREEGGTTVRAEGALRYDDPSPDPTAGPPPPAPPAPPTPPAPPAPPALAALRARSAWLGLRKVPTETEATGKGAASAGAAAAAAAAGGAAAASAAAGGSAPRAGAAGSAARGAGAAAAAAAGAGAGATAGAATAPNCRCQ
jgi:hypothetical protein